MRYFMHGNIFRKKHKAHVSKHKAHIFKTSALYFKIYALYFSRFQMYEKQQLTKPDFLPSFF